MIGTNRRQSLECHLRSQAYVLGMAWMVACGKPTPPETPVPTVAPPPPVASSSPSAPLPPPPAQSTPDQPAPESGPSGAAAAAAVAAYNVELAAWINSRDTIPRDMNQLRQIQGMPPIPKVPPGKRIVYVPNFDRPTMSHIRLE